MLHDQPMMLDRQYGQSPWVCSHGSKQLGWNLCPHCSCISPSPSKNLSRHIQHSDGAFATPPPAYLKTFCSSPSFSHSDDAFATPPSSACPETSCCRPSLPQLGPGGFLLVSQKESVRSVWSVSTARGILDSEHSLRVWASQSPETMTLKSSLHERLFPEMPKDEVPCLGRNKEVSARHCKNAAYMFLCSMSWRCIFSSNLEYYKQINRDWWATCFLYYKNTAVFHEPLLVPAPQHEEVDHLTHLWLPSTRCLWNSISHHCCCYLPQLHWCLYGPTKSGHVPDDSRNHPSMIIQQIQIEFLCSIFRKINQVSAEWYVVHK